MFNIVCVCVCVCVCVLTYLLFISSLDQVHFLKAVGFEILDWAVFLWS